MHGLLTENNFIVCCVDKNVYRMFMFSEIMQNEHEKNNKIFS